MFNIDVTDDPFNYNEDLLIDDDKSIFRYLPSTTFHDFIVDEDTRIRLWESDLRFGYSSQLGLFVREIDQSLQSNRFVCRKRSEIRTISEYKTVFIIDDKEVVIRVEGYVSVCIVNKHYLEAVRIGE